MTSFCILNPKGGTGKTTLAINLARALSIRGSRVLLVDCDPQGSSLAWAALAEETPFVVGRSVSPGFDFQVQDMPPRFPDKLPSADFFLVPTTLDGVSFAVFLRFIDRLKEEGKRFVPVVTRFNDKRSEHKQRLKDPDLADAVLIRERACFASCYAQGTTVFDMTSPHVVQAQADIVKLIDALGFSAPTPQEDAEGAKENP